MDYDDEEYELSEFFHLRRSTNKRQSCAQFVPKILPAVFGLPGDIVLTARRTISLNSSWNGIHILL
jgi:hypothetical protein